MMPMPPMGMMPGMPPFAPMPGMPPMGMPMPPMGHMMGHMMPMGKYHTVNAV